MSSGSRGRFADDLKRRMSSQMCLAVDSFILPRRTKKNCIVEWNAITQIQMDAVSRSPAPVELSLSFLRCLFQNGRRRPCQLLWNVLSPCHASDILEGGRSELRVSGVSLSLRRERRKHNCDAALRTRHLSEMAETPRVCTSTGKRHFSFQPAARKVRGNGAGRHRDVRVWSRCTSVGRKRHHVLHDAALHLLPLERRSESTRRQLPTRSALSMEQWQCHERACSHERAPRKIHTHSFAHAALCSECIRSGDR
jgi:hypothetical protein